MKTPALFLDIEGVLIRDIESHENLENMRFIRSAGKALSEIKRVAKQKIIISTLKNSNRLGIIRKHIDQNFILNKSVIESKDIIFFLEKK